MKITLNKSQRSIEYFARLVLLASIIVLAMWTVFTSPLGQVWFVRAFLILFIVAAFVVFVFDVRHLFPRQSSKQQENIEIPKSTEMSSRNKWILVVILALMAIIIVAIFVPRQLQLDPQGYQTFYMAFAATGAWVTGIALAVFAYQQYKLRQTEHRVLFEPQIILTAGIPSITIFINKKEPYQIKWTVFIQNTSQIPILIRHMTVHVKLAEEDSGRQALITPMYCHVVEPSNLRIPFEVTLSKPQYTTWVVEGSSAGDAFDYVSGESGNRDFALILKVIAKRPQDPPESVFSKEVISWGIHVPQDANWTSKTIFG